MQAPWSINNTIYTPIYEPQSENRINTVTLCDMTYALCEISGY